MVAEGNFFSLSKLTPEFLAALQDQHILLENVETLHNYYPPSGNRSLSENSSLFCYSKKE